MVHEVSNLQLLLFGQLDVSQHRVALAHQALVSLGHGHVLEEQLAHLRKNVEVSEVGN